MKRTHFLLPAIAGFAASVALGASPAWSATKSASDIACELGGDCADTQPEAAADTPADTADVVAEDEPPTRGWTFGSKPKAKDRPAEPVVNRPAQRVVAAPRPRPVEFSTIDVQFPLGSSAISGDAVEQMDELYNALRRPGLTGRKYRIVGHTVAVGSPALNKELSMRRAKAVLDFLASKGLDSSQFVIDGMGDARPLSGVTRYDPANRRVEIARID